MSFERLAVLRALVTELPVHLIGRNFYVVSNEIQELDGAAVARLRLRASLAQRGGHKALRRPVPLVKSLLQLLGAGQTSEYRDAKTKKHTRKLLMGPATLETLETLEELGASVVSARLETVSELGRKLELN